MYTDVHRGFRAPEQRRSSTPQLSSPNGGASRTPPLVAAVPQQPHHRAHDAVRDPGHRLGEAASGSPSRSRARPAARPRRSSRSSSTRSWPAKRGSRTNTFASRAISSEYGSMFDEPTVAQRVVDDRDLGVQERAMIFLDRDAGVEQLPVQRARRVVQQPVLDARLQQQRHAHAARGRRDQRAAKADAGKEVRVGDDDLAAARCGSPRGRRARCRAGGAGCRGSMNFAVCVPARCGATAPRREQRHVAAAQLRRARRSPTRAASSGTIGTQQRAARRAPRSRRAAACARACSCRR